MPTSSAMIAMTTSSSISGISEQSRNRRT
jgi:hypothetical protein